MYLIGCDIDEVVIKGPSRKGSPRRRKCFCVSASASASARARQIVMRVIGACYRTEPVSRSERSKRSLKPP